MKTKITVIITFVIMILVNTLANTLPINGITTGEVSDSYVNLFAPAGFTFSIWGLIYLLLAAFTVYQTIDFSKYKSDNTKLLLKIGAVFSISSIINSIWIFAWHYKVIGLTFFLMLGILVCLIMITNTIKNNTLTTKEKLLIKLPFSIYFGWITVATIANTTTLLVSLGWGGFGISEAVWAVIIILAGAVIGCFTIIRNKDYAYGLVIIWAYIGIMAKHTSSNGFNGIYPQVITTVIICLILLVITTGFAIKRNTRLE